MMQSFRKVKLNLPGSLYLHSMPGRLEPYPACCEAIQNASIDRIICLNRMEELQQKSPEYLKAIQDEILPCEWTHFPIGNFGVPDDKAVFMTLARESAAQLEAGANLLIHCAGGVGRTGTLASCIVAALNQPVSLITDAGGEAETEQQQAFIAALKAG